LPHQSFARILHRETADFVFYEDTLPALEALKAQGYRLGLVSNLWPFPVRVLFEELGLGAYFEHMIYSYEVGHAKPEPEIFEKALELFGVQPEEVLMVGDNPVNDVQGAMAVGMQAALIDRSGEENVVVPGALVLRSLLDLCQLDPASIEAA
jgi:putative hydrolase of the HAD superfamily